VTTSVIILALCPAGLFKGFLGVGWTRIDPPIEVPILTERATYAEIENNWSMSTCFVGESPVQIVTRKRNNLIPDDITGIRNINHRR
ncbi:32459_t:CDS:1, partial [Gigaspora margarita]